MKKFSLVVLLLLTSVRLSEAQTSQVSWDQSGVTSPTQAQSFVYKLYVTPSGTTNTSMYTLSSVLCGGVSPTVNCSTVLPAIANSATQIGARSELTTTDPASGSESARSAPFLKPAAAPTSLRITP
jgi:hypothetical protein